MICIKNVCKIYQNGYVANNNITFDINVGEIVGLVGPNGSGKTTLIRQLMGTLSCTNGVIKVNDKDKDYVNLIAFSPQHAALYMHLSVKETIFYTLRYCGFSKKHATNNALDIIQKLKLTQITDKPIYTLSGGQLKVVNLACALAQNKKYIIMDEPTSMVDIVSKDNIWSVLGEEKKERAILISSHDINEVQQLCDKIIVLNKGEIVFAGSPTEIDSDYVSCEIIVTKTKELKIFLEENNIEYTKKENTFEMLFKDIVSLLKITNEISNIFEIEKFVCQYPSIYKGVMSRVK